MPDSTNFYASDRVLVIDDERQRTVDLSDFKLELPVVGIFDEPRRCYPINKEWAKIVTGAVSLLLEIAVWPDAEHEGYQGINQILEFLKGEDCMNCDDIEDCLETSTTITNINNTINNNNVSIDVNSTTINNVFPPAEQTENIGGDPPAPEPGDDCNNDAIWSACFSVVEYIDAQNRDFLQELDSATNLAQGAAKAVAATPALGLTTADETVDFVAFMIDSLLVEYNAIVDTALLQSVTCDLFCIAINNEPCGLQFGDLIDYFSGKVAPSAGQAVDTFANLVQFSITHTFSGDQYFYYMSYFQLWIAFAGQEFLGQRGVNQFGLQAAAGYNSPDADWELFCDECPPETLTVTYDFTVTDGGFTKGVAGNRGVWVSGLGWQSEIGGTTPQQGLIIYKSLPALGEIKAAKMEYSVEGIHTWSVICGLRDFENSGAGQILIINTSTTTSGCKDGAINPSEHRNLLLCQINTPSTTPDKAVLTSLVLEWAVEKPTGWTSEGESVVC
jgi:hypothetical protein